MVGVMEYTWKIRGSHANWQMTLTIEPADDRDALELRCWNEKDMDGLASHFEDSARLWEMYEEYEPSA
jgi:hypothetical protein